MRVKVSCVAASLFLITAAAASVPVRPVMAQSPAPAQSD
jgi:hypothetical protein